MQKEKILLIGGGGHCKSCIDVIEQQGIYEIAGIIDRPEKKGDVICGYKILGSDNDLPIFFSDIKNVLITVGQIKNNVLKTKLYLKAKSIGFKLPIIVAPTAYVSQHTTIGEGSIVMHQAFINAGVIIGENTIVNTKALIEHDVHIGSHCHISTSTTLNGDVQIGNDCFIGSNACVNHGVEITNKVIVGSNSTVYKNIEESGIYFTNNPLSLK